MQTKPVNTRKADLVRVQELLAAILKESAGASRTRLDATGWPPPRFLGNVPTLYLTGYTASGRSRTTVAQLIAKAGMVVV
jgi:hypothetical protein